MTRTATEMTVPEAARRLDLPGGEVYRLVFRGELDGTPGLDGAGAVYVSAASVEPYLDEHQADGGRSS